MNTNTKTTTGSGRHEDSRPVRQDAPLRQRQRQMTQRTVTARAHAPACRGTCRRNSQATGAGWLQDGPSPWTLVAGRWLLDVSRFLPCPAQTTATSRWV